LKIPLVLTLPHCSDAVPEGVRAELALDAGGILDSVDLGTREVFGRMPAASVLCAVWSRLVVDLNRGPGERGAKGVVPERDYDGRQVYGPGRYPDEDTLKGRIERYYAPFHRRVRRMLDRPGTVGLLDCHSMNAVGPAGAPDAGMDRLDITLSNNGDHRGEASPALGAPSCPSQLLGSLKAALEEQGFSVSLNRPYAGGFITVHYGEQLRQENRFALQMELNQGLYTGADRKTVLPRRTREVSERITRALHGFAAPL